MQPILVEETVDLRQHPDLSKKERVHSVTLGDLHGNSLKLFYFLIREGILTLTNPKQYDYFAEVYCKGIDELTVNELTTVQSIVNMSSVYTKIKVCLIGDELADRGSNDYFTILLLEKLHAAGVNLEICLSNHGVEFINAYESGDFINSGFFEIMPFQSGSLYALKKLATLFPELNTVEQVRSFVDNTYKSSLKLISYDADIGSKKIFIRTHAPCDLTIIREAADYLHIPYNDDSLQNLINSIEKIQQRISECIAHSSLTRLIQNNPLRLLLWNRNTESLIDLTQPRKIIRQETLHDFSIHYIHGHTEGVTNHYVTNLDTSLGKSQGRPASFMSTPQISEFHHKGVYKVLRIIDTFKSKPAKLPSK